MINTKSKTPMDKSKSIDGKPDLCKSKEQSYHWNERLAVVKEGEKVNKSPKAVPLHHI